MPTQTPKMILFIVVITESILAFVGVCALAASLFWKAYTDPAILTAFISITSGLVGSLASILSNTRQAPANGSTTTSTTTTTPAKVTPDQTPTPVVVKQPDSAPIPVVETPTSTESKP